MSTDWKSAETGGGKAGPGMALGDSGEIQDRRFREIRDIHDRSAERELFPD
jgi:hypothetical protein